MNLNIIPHSIMIVISGEWLANPRITTEVKRHPLGGPLWKELEDAHKVVLAFIKQRMALEARLAEMVKILARLDGIHDRKARSLRNLLIYLAEATDDPALAAFFRELDELMFPHQLRIVHMSYMEEAGKVMEVEQRVSAEILRKLDTIHVADQTLGDIYRDWVEAGKELGRYVQERARIEASLKSDGTTASQTHSRQVRSVWINAVHLLLDALKYLDLSESTREDLLAPLERSIREAKQRHEQGDADGDDVALEPGSDADVTADSDAPADVGVAVEGTAAEGATGDAHAHAVKPEATAAASTGGDAVA